MQYKLKQKLTFDMLRKLAKYDRIRVENIRLRKRLLQGVRYGAKLSKLLRGLYVQK